MDALVSKLLSQLRDPSRAPDVNLARQLAQELANQSGDRYRVSMLFSGRYRVDPDWCFAVDPEALEDLHLCDLVDPEPGFERASD